MPETEIASSLKEPFGVNRTKRLTINRAEQILYEFKPLFNKDGFVRLVDYIGGDKSIEYATTGGIGPRLIGNIDTRDIFNYLHSHGILDPFDFVQVKLHLEIPISSALFWVYRRPFKINEYSGRYSEMVSQMRNPTVEEIETLLSSVEIKSPQKKEEIIQKIVLAAQSQARGSYEAMLSANFARELARIGLPIDNFTSFYLSANLHDLLQSVEITRKRSKTNPDINAIGEAIYEILESIAPLAVESFLNRRKSDLELKVNYELLEETPSGEPRFGESFTRRVTAPEAEEELFKPKVFLENSWFMPVDYMGTDASIVQSARVSYGAGTTKVSDDTTLIRYLRRHLHTTPFEHVSVQFEAKTPIFVSPRQCLRHRTIFREGVLGEVVPLKAYYNIPDNQIKEQSKSNRQGRGRDIDELGKEVIRKNLEATFTTQDYIRKRLVEEKLPRSFEPGVSLESGISGVGHLNIWSGAQDLHNAFHLLRLRNDPHAQLEIQEFARKYQEFIMKVAPIAYQAWLDYEKKAIRITNPERDLFSRMIKEGRTEIPFKWFKEKGWTRKNKGTGEEEPNREAEELKEKLNNLLDQR